MLRRMAIILAAVVVIAVVAVAVLWFTREQPGSRPVDDAVEDFRGTPGADSDATATIPPAGVYLADGAGEARINLPPASQSWGNQVLMTVTPQGGSCWRTRIDFNEAHRQIWVMCVDGSEVTVTEDLTETRWDFGIATLDNVTTFVCDEPPVFIDLAATPGTTWEHDCTGTNDSIDGPTAAAGPYRYVGATTVDIADTAVPVRHYRQERNLTGAQDGISTADLYFAEDNNLLLRLERSINLSSDSPVGQVSYNEEGSWQLSSTTPRR